MAVYTPIDKKHLSEIAEDYNLGKLAACAGITAGSVNTNYLLETSRGKFLLRIDEVKNELDVKRELDLISSPQARISVPAAARRRAQSHYRDSAANTSRCTAGSRASRPWAID
jgi:homoserine kinase type II